jgi:putative transposase
MGFIDTLRAEGYAVESICRLLREQGCQIAARTYRAWKRQQPAAGTISDALVMNAIRTASFTTDVEGRRRLSPEGLYGRRMQVSAELRGQHDGHAESESGKRRSWFTAQHSPRM